LLLRAEETAGIPVHDFVPGTEDGEIDRAVAEAEEMLRPCGRQKAYEGVAFAARVVGAKAPANDVLSAYAAVLEHVPADLLAKALRAGLADQEWHVLPAPGLFLRHVREEIETRRERLGLLKRHRNRVQLASRTRRPADTQKLEAVEYRPISTRLRRMDTDEG
jgi:hypothetical protein